MDELADGQQVAWPATALAAMRVRRVVAPRTRSYKNALCVVTGPTPAASSVTRATVSETKPETNATYRPSLLIDGTRGSIMLGAGSKPAAARNWQLLDFAEASATDRSYPLVLDLDEDEPVAPQ